MERKEGFKCFYCGKVYDDPLKVIGCQNSHEEVIKKNNTDALNHYIITELLNKEEISDGVYKFKDLYLHKEVLFVAVMTMLSNERVPVWYTDNYPDGSTRPGFILVGAFYEPEKQIVLSISEKNLPYLRIIGEKVPVAPNYSSATANETVDRIYKFVIERLLAKRYHKEA